MIRFVKTPARAGLLALAAIAGFLAASTAGPARAVSALFGAESFTLDNGIRVVLVSDHRVPVVTHMVWYRVGSADEPPGKSGIAHLLEHLMFKGTPANPGDTFTRTVQRLGGELNAFTSYDYTGYFETVPAEHLDSVMALEADRMTNLVLDDADVLTERDVVVEERRQRTDNNPEALLAEQVSAALYLNHRYGVPVIGWTEELRSLTREDALSFYRRWYGPSNAIVVVAGDVTLDRLKTLAERHYGAIDGPAILPRSRAVEPVHRAARRVTVRDESVRPGAWLREYLAPSAVAGEMQLAPALEVLAEALGNDAFGVLARDLVKERELAARVGVHYRAAAINLTGFSISVIPRPGVALAAVEAAVDEVLARVRESGIDAETIARARRSLTAGTVRARDGTMRSAQAIGAALTAGIALDEIEAWPRSIEAVDVEDVQAAAREVLRDRRSVTGTLVPMGAELAAGAAAANRHAE